MPQGSFSAQVNDWVKGSKARMVAVRNEAAQRTIEIMQTPVAKGGNLPVDTGFLRASLKAAIGTANFQEIENDASASLTYNPEDISLIISGADISDTIEAVYTAKYARRMNYGFSGEDSLGRVYNQAPRLFVDLAAQQWPQIVDQVAREAEGRAGG